tara:strand:- start:797 stop:2572 length:1776 start_codon:yes stop_codon:yes gene_type:complete
LKSTELLSYLSDLELKLNSFSFEELTSEEAKRLKKSFQSFKENLEEKTVFKNLNSSAKLVQKANLHEIVKGNNKINENSEEMLIAKVSHEIRTPLNGIIGFTELLSEGTLTNEQTSHVNAIKGASNTLLNIINELLEYSKLTSGTAYFEDVDFNFYSLLNDVSYLCKTLIINPNVVFNISISKNIPEIIKGDPSKLSQILLNLIGNAIKFVNDGKIDLSIDILAKNDETVLLNFKVKDTGIGISKDNLENIFDYYKQAEINTYKSYGGTGLGLSIVKHIVESLNGKITVASELGVGSEFNFELPYKISQLSEIQTSISFTEDLKKKEKLIKNMNILVFEDNTMNQKLIQNRLNSWGCKSFVTDVIEEGLMVLENGKIDLVLMDLRMPETSGFVVAKIIRNNKSSKINKTPIIALTADFTVKDKNLCAENGINDYILKPFDSKELLHKLVSNINRTKKIENMRISPIISKVSVEDPFDIDLAPVFEECFGDIELLEELIRLFKQNAIEFIGKTRVSLKATDIDAIAFSTHKIKSGLKMMHTNGLYRIVDQMHKVCIDDQDFKYLNFLYDCFLKEYPIVENAIENALDKIKRN